MNKNAIFGFIALISCCVQAKTPLYHWDTELCHLQAHLHPAYSNTAQLDGSLMFTRLAGSVLLSAPSFVFEPTQITSISIAAIDQEYQRTKLKLQHTPVLPDFAALKQRTLSRLDIEYAINRLEAQAVLGNTRVLLEPSYGKAALRDAQMLNHPDANLRVSYWDQITLEHIAAQEALGNTGYRKIALSRQQQQKQKDPQGYARLDLIAAWRNHLQTPQDAIDQQDSRTDWNPVFIRAAHLTHLQQECDEP